MNHDSWPPGSGISMDEYNYIKVNTKVKLMKYKGILCNYEEAYSEIVNEGSRKVLQIHKNRPGCELNATYLGLVVNSSICDYIKKECKYTNGIVSINDDDDESDEMEIPFEDQGFIELEENEEKEENRNIVYQIIDNLNDVDRRLLILRYNDELSYQQIEEKTGIKAGTLRTKYSRLISKIKKPALQELKRKENYENLYI